MNIPATVVSGAPRASSYVLQQVVRAFSANATSWIGLVTFLVVVALALAVVSPAPKRATILSAPMALPL